jgi:hypothetical protein
LHASIGYIFAVIEFSSYIMPLYKINDEVRQLFQAAHEIQPQIDELKSKKGIKERQKIICS